MTKDNISKDSVDIAVLEQRVDGFENNCKDFKGFLSEALKSITKSNEAIASTNTEILIRINTLEAKQKIYITIFGAIAGFIGSHLPSVLKGLFIFIFSGD